MRCLLKTGNVNAEETWVGSLFQTRDAADEKDFEVAIDVFLNGADMVMEDSVTTAGIFSLDLGFLTAV